MNKSVEVEKIVEIEDKEENKEIEVKENQEMEIQDENMENQEEVIENDS